NARSQAEKDKELLHISLALVPVDPGQVEYLTGRILKANIQEVTVIRDALLTHQSEVSASLWSILIDPERDSNERLRAACAVATYPPNDPHWEGVSGDVLELLIAQNSLVRGDWAKAFKPVRKLLLPLTASLLADEKRTGWERSAIADLYQT